MKPAQIINLMLFINNIHIYVDDDGLAGFIIIGDIISRRDWEDFFKFIN